MSTVNTRQLNAVSSGPAYRSHAAEGSAATLASAAPGSTVPATDVKFTAIDDVACRRASNSRRRMHS